MFPPSYAGELAAASPETKEAKETNKEARWKWRKRKERVEEEAAREAAVVCVAGAMERAGNRPSSPLEQAAGRKIGVERGGKLVSRGFEERRR